MTIPINPIAPTLAASTTAILVLLSSTVNPALGHGYVKSPRSRNIVAFEDGVSWIANPLPSTPKKENDPMSLNRGGLCGVSPRAFNSTHKINYAHPPNYSGGFLPQNVQATYDQGEIIDFEVILTAHHMGHIEYKACPLEKHGDTPTQECFDDHPLEFVADVSYKLPPDANYPNRCYVPPPGWMNNGGAGLVMKHQFRLPADLNGDLVLIQWHYVTGNSCLDAGYDDYFNSPTAPNFSPGNLPSCSQPLNMCGEGAPEQFWNCIEVTIRPSVFASPSPIPAAGPASLGCASELTGGSGPIMPPLIPPPSPPTPLSPTPPSPTPPSPTPPSPSPPISTTRCGTSFKDANSKCGATCGEFHGLCTSPEGCFTDLAVDVCSDVPTTPSPPPPVGPTTPSPETSTTIQDTTTPSPPGSPKDLIADAQPRCGPSEMHAREMCNPVCTSLLDCPSGEWCWGTQLNYCSDPNFSPQGYIEGSVSTSTVTHRCGTSEIDARSFCKAPCMHDTQCNMAQGEGCYGVHSNYCGSPSSTSRRTLLRANAREH